MLTVTPTRATAMALRLAFASKTSENIALKYAKTGINVKKVDDFSLHNNKQCSLIDIYTHGKCESIYLLFNFQQI